MYPDVTSWSDAQKALWLTTLAHQLTVCARASDDRGDLSPLRAYNELMHRVTAAARDYLKGNEGIPLSVVFEMLTDFAVRHDLRERIESAVRFTNRLCAPEGRTGV